MFKRALNPLKQRINLKIIILDNNYDETPNIKNLIDERIHYHQSKKI